MADLRTRAAEHANPTEPDDVPLPTRNEVAARMAAASHPVTLPDLDQSGIEASMDVPVHIAWSRVMGDVQWIGKGRSEGLRYEFRGIDAVLNAVGPALRKHGVSVVQTLVEPTYATTPTSNNKLMNLCRVTVTYQVIGPRGDFLPFALQSVGEAFDSGDKATPKAVSVALRSLYINSLAIPTGEPKMDPEHGPQYEIATPPRPTAEQYRAEIVNEATTVPRLRAIREELRAEPATAQTVIEDVDGSQMTLIKLVAKVGNERAAKE
jgi:ERF superfamily protein